MKLCGISEPRVHILECYGDGEIHLTNTFSHSSFAIYCSACMDQCPEATAHLFSLCVERKHCSSFSARSFEPLLLNSWVCGSKNMKYTGGATFPFSLAVISWDRKKISIEKTDGGFWGLNVRWVMLAINFLVHTCWVPVYLVHHEAKVISATTQEKQNKMKQNPLCKESDTKEDSPPRQCSGWHQNLWLLQKESELTVWSTGENFQFHSSQQQEELCKDTWN